MQQDALHIEQRLQELLQGGPAPLVEAMRYATLGGGKRLRPVLCLWTTELLQGDPARALDVACAVELLHTYSLVHDDLPCMDDDDLRRGRPTVHVRFGEAMAVLVGDALQSLAFATLLRAPWPSAEAAVAGAIDLANAAGPEHLVGGQLLDLMAENGTPDAKRVEDIHLRKTAALLQCAMVLGARVAAASAPDLQRIRDIGLDLGLAFQIIDDLLDETSASATLGKTAGKDRQVGKLTWPAVHGQRASQQRATQLVETATEALRHWQRHEKLVWLATYLHHRVA
jgi:geranylgeranyl diphosphate synthase type II